MIIFRNFGRWIILWLIMVLLAGCGGGGGDFEGPAEVSVRITADRTNLPLNSVNALPNPGGPFTNTITVQVKTEDGRLQPSDITVAVSPSLASGALYYLDGDPEHEDDEGRPSAYRTIVLEGTSGIATAHFHAFDVPGSVVLTASTVDPNTGRSVSNSLEITVGSGASTGQPSEIGFEIPQFPLYIANNDNNLPTQKTITLVVLDDGNQLVPDPQPGVSNLRVQLRSEQLNDNAFIAGVDASGNAVTGTTIDLRTTNGIAEVSLHSGALPGFVNLDATTDRDNSLSNGIATPVTRSVVVSISDGKVFSIELTGNFINAVNSKEGEENFEHIFDICRVSDDVTIIRDNDDEFSEECTLDDNTISWTISAIAMDRFGNPAPAGTPISFYLVDAPITGFPGDIANSAGRFVNQGMDGNPQEGGNLFTSPTGNFVSPDIRPFDQLILDGSGNNAGHVGSRIIDQILSQTSLTVDRAFDLNDQSGSVVDAGNTVPYIIGRAEHGTILTNVPTDDRGVATTLLTYPLTRLGQTAVIVAEAEGGEVATVLNPGGPVFIGGVFDPVLTTSHTSLGPNTSTDVTLCLKDAKIGPLARVPLEWSVEGANANRVTVTPSDPVTGTDGCVTVNITTEGQIAGSEPIKIKFITANRTSNTVDITVESPGAGTLTGTVAANGTVTLRLIDANGNPIPDTFITHTFTVDDVDNSDPDADPPVPNRIPAASVSYDPPSQLTRADGTLTARITLSPGDAGDTLTVIFKAVGGAEFSVTFSFR